MSIRRSLVNALCRLCQLPTLDYLQAQTQVHQAELDRREQQQQALYRVISKIRASLELEVIFRTTAKETCQLLQVDRVAVYQFDENWGGTFVSNFEFAEPTWGDVGNWGQQLIWDDTYLQDHQGGRYRHNEPLVTPDIYTAGLSQCHVEILEQFCIRAYATVPIFVGKTLWGVLGAYQHSGPRQWTQQEIKFLSQVSGQLGFAVKQSELLTDARQKALKLQQANEWQDILSHIVAEIRHSLELDVVFTTTAREVRKALRADRVGIFQFEPDSNYEYGKFVAEDVLPEYDSAIAIRVRDRCFGDSYASQYHQGRSQVWPDIYAAGLSKCHIDVLEQFQIRAQIIVPLIRRDQLWGLLCIHQCRRSRQWQPAEVQFVGRLAEQFSVALDHADVLNQVTIKTAQLTDTVAALEQANRQLEDLSRLDPLTQIANRGWFNAVLRQEWNRLQRTQLPLSLILFDIDYFKRFNDRLGHLAGDQCLCDIAQAVQAVIHRPADLFARYGGEEFAVILPETGSTGAIAVAQSIRQAVLDLAIATHPETRDRPPIVTVSLGIASHIPHVGISEQVLIEQADKVLYQAKEQGRNQWAFYG
ncbi:MAG: diguanylate cyclase [Leptolyngbyaceae cyanobacterium]